MDAFLTIGIGKNDTLIKAIKDDGWVRLHV